MGDVQQRVSKWDLYAQVARELGMSRAMVARVGDHFLDAIAAAAAEGKIVGLRGFGVFRLQLHKGHKVRFKNDTRIPDYQVLKFSASGSLNKQFREQTVE